MFAIFKRTLIFVGPKGEKLKIQAKAEAQTAPEWIRKTREFQLSYQDGSIMETKAAGTRRTSDKT